MIDVQGVGGYLIGGADGPARLAEAGPQFARESDHIVRGHDDIGMAYSLLVE